MKTNEFDQERREAINKMIEKRINQLNSKEAELQKTRDSIGKCMADIEFWDAQKKDGSPEYNTLISTVKTLKIDYKNHVNGSTEKQLNKEIAILQSLL